MPYRNLTGWLATGAVFMSVAAFFWRKTTIVLTRAQLTTPLVIYLVNFAFGAIITVYQLDVRFWIPTAIGALFGVVPAIGLWWSVKPGAAIAATNATPVAGLEMAVQADVTPDAANIASDVPVVPVAVVSKSPSC